MGLCHLGLWASVVMIEERRVPFRLAGRPDGWFVPNAFSCLHRGRSVAVCLGSGPGLAVVSTVDTRDDAKGQIVIVVPVSRCNYSVSYAFTTGHF
jgi:hypothetical protein